MLNLFRKRNLDAPQVKSLEDFEGRRSEPRHQRTHDIEELRWMQKYVLGLDWTPWVRPEKDDQEKKPVTNS